MMDPHQPPLPQEEPLRVSDPPLPPTEPVSHPRPSKRLGIGNADGSKLITGPPSKKSRKFKDANGLGIKPPIGVTAEELQALEDGELEDSDDSGVKETYIVINKKARKKSPGQNESKRRESLESEQQPAEFEEAPSRNSMLEDSAPTVKKELVLPEGEVPDTAVKTPPPDSLTGYSKTFLFL